MIAEENMRVRNERDQKSIIIISVARSRSTTLYRMLFETFENDNELEVRQYSFQSGGLPSPHVFILKML